MTIPAFHLAVMQHQLEAHGELVLSREIARDLFRQASTACDWNEELQLPLPLEPRHGRGKLVSIVAPYDARIER